jgi:iron complex transport system permease protein
VTSHTRSLLIIIFIVGIVVIATAPFLGVIKISFLDLYDGELSKIFWSVRVPRVLLAFFVGSVLSVCGSVYQSIFRNPLASPYTLGVSSGAAVGTTIVMMFLSSQFLSGNAVIIGGILGAIMTTGFVSFLGFSVKGDSQSRLLLAGVILSFFLSSIVLFLQYIADFSEIFRMTRWLMGSLEVVGYHAVGIIAVISFFTLLISILKSDELGLIAIDAEFAKSKGVSVERTIFQLFSITSIAIGIVVTFCGPIGFVGIAVPYLARAVVGCHCRLQLILSYFLGGIVLLACDTFARVVIAPAEIPVGVVTALIASPFVLVILLRQGNSLRTI